MTRRRIRPTAGALFTLAAIAAALVLFPGPAGAQRAVLATGGFLETYEFLDPTGTGIERISVASLPFGVTAPVVDRFSVDLRGSFARGSMTRMDGSEATLTGLTDTELRGNYEVVRDRLTLSAALLLPTGHSTQTLEEAELAGFVAADLLPFRISNWGSGGGAGIVSTFAVPVGDFGLGISAGYTVGQEFDPLEDEEFAYRPGNEARVRLVVDRNVGTSTKASLILGGQIYADDEVDGSSAFTPGDRFEAIGSVAFRVGQLWTGVAFGGVQHRGEGRLLEPSLETPSQNLFNAGIGFRIPRGVTTLVPMAEVRIFRRSDGLGQGHLTSLGATVEWPVGPVVLLPTLRGRFGKALLWDGAESSVRGAEVGLGLRYRTR